MYENFYNLNNSEMQEILDWAENEMPRDGASPTASQDSSKAQRGLYSIGQGHDENDDGSKTSEESLASTVLCSDKSDSPPSFVFTVSDFDSGDSFMSAYEKSVLNTKMKALTKADTGANRELFPTARSKLYYPQAMNDDKMDILEPHFTMPLNLTVSSKHDSEASFFFTPPMCGKKR